MGLSVPRASPVTVGSSHRHQLDVSATIASAADVLRVCAPVLAEARCPFTVVGSSATLRRLNDRRASRRTAGTFLRAYPGDREQLARLAMRLHEATHRLAGPRVLSGTPFCAGSVVHLRDGVSPDVLDNDGGYRDDDHRRGPTGPILLANRYVVTVAIRHANKGGVYLAHDTRTQSLVVIKEGRRHVATDDYGRDARDFIYHEAEVLHRLQSSGVAPKFVDVFDLDDHAYLVEEGLPGVSLDRWVFQQLNEGRQLTHVMWCEIAEALTRLIGVVHESGVILRNFNPDNVLIDQDHRLRLVDFELAQLDPDAPAIDDGSEMLEFAAPEQTDGAAPAPSADLYSLGAMLMFLATGVRPAARFSESCLPGRPPNGVVDLIRALLSEEPSRRPTSRDVVRALSAQRLDAPDARVNLWQKPSASDACSQLRVLSTEQWEELVDGIVAYLVSTADMSGSSARLWPESAWGRDTEPCAVQHGMGGVLAVLARLYRHRPTPDVQRLLITICERITCHVRDVEHHLPGLYFGASGTALALCEAGTVLERRDLIDLGDEMLRDLPRRWPNCDITHGVAGLGTALLLRWQYTGDSDLACLVADIADGIAAARCDDGAQVTWTVPNDFESSLAGYSSYGFAHGTAGIGAFLLRAGGALGRDDLIAIAQRCGESLVKTAARDEDGAARWPEGPGTPGLLTHWCNGSSGVGTLLVRLYAAIGDPVYLEMSNAAARAIMRQRWYSGTAYCHGLAGDGDFLLDLAQITGDAIYPRWAQEIACTFFDRRIYRQQRALLPNDTGVEITADFGTGLAGHLAFLLRLGDGGPRMFHP